MRKEIVKALLAAAEEIGTSECSMYEDYSGRGMFGNTTTGLVIENLNDLYQIVAVASVRVKEDESDLSWEDFCEDLGTWRQDSLGRSTILY